MNYVFISNVKAKFKRLNKRADSLEKRVKELEEQLRRLNAKE